MFQKQLANFFKICLYSAFFICQCSYALYLGTEFGYSRLYPVLSCTNLVREWLEKSGCLVEVALGDYYSNNAFEFSKQEIATNNLIKAGVEQETFLLHKSTGSPALVLFFGGGNLVQNNFYLGAEARLEYTPVKLIEKKEGEIVVKYENAFFFRHELNGEIKIDRDVNLKKNMSIGGVIRLGFCPQKDLLLYVSLGTTLNFYNFENFEVLWKSELKNITRRNDIEDSNIPIIKNFSPTKYEIKKKDFFSTSLDLGAGLERKFRKNLFVRAEYIFKINFFHPLSEYYATQTEEILGIQNRVRYQDKEQKFCLGFGINF